MFETKQYNNKITESYYNKEMQLLLVSEQNSLERNSMSPQNETKHRIALHFVFKTPLSVLC